MGTEWDLQRIWNGLTSDLLRTHPRVLSLSRKLVTMNRKIIPKNCIFKTQRRRGAKIILEHEKHKTNENFSLFCVFRVQTKYP